ncbi:MAG: Gfo/Idh/MocA family oxidoreductase [Rhodobacteraceae bacterium]|nr:Gfo/Idh/MocA family oxidoreductase [Paracoccaceae bacterium]
MTKPRIAIFGAGLAGARHMVQAMAQADLCAIADPAPRGQTLARQHGIPCYRTPEECLQAQRPDAVVIASPNHLHAQHALLCLEQGLPVLVEKPIADTLANADRIIAKSKATAVPVLVGHHRRHTPIVQRAQALIQQGCLGEIVALCGQFWLYKPRDYFAEPWRNQPGAGGPLLINLIHDVDILRYLCGDISELYALRGNRQRRGLVEDSAALVLRFANGALGSFSVSDTIVAPWSWEMTAAENPIYPHTQQSCYKIGGTHGSLSLPDLQIWQHVGPRSWWVDIGSRSLRVAPKDAFVAQFAHFCQVIEGAPPMVSAQEARASLAVVLRAMQGAMGGADGVGGADGMGDAVRLPDAR